MLKTEFQSHTTQLSPQSQAAFGDESTGEDSADTSVSKARPRGVTSCYLEEASEMFPKCGNAMQPGGQHSPGPPWPCFLLCTPLYMVLSSPCDIR